MGQATTQSQNDKSVRSLRGGQAQPFPLALGSPGRVPAGPTLSASSPLNTSRGGQASLALTFWGAGQSGLHCQPKYPHFHGHRGLWLMSVLPHTLLLVQAFFTFLRA